MEIVGAYVPIALMIAWARATAKTLGPKECFKTGVGPVLQELRADISPVVVGPYSNGAREALRRLEINCRCCPHSGKCKAVPKDEALYG